ncbi:hypothetical protein ACFWMQ_05650 [Streptomyces sp. NPDC058372]|uniref:hypothetical protein n=1 Tax=unclassified Streptomyces TaxID=2593676 RepID=UPI00364C64B9
MGDIQILGRGGRVAGSVVSAVLAAVTLGWIVRDLARGSGPDDLWWQWAGWPGRYGLQEVAYTAGQDVLLLLVYAVVAVKVMRSASAAVMLAATGALTVALRLPAVVALVGEPEGVELFGGPTPGALLTTAGSVLGGAALIVVAAAGRRAAGPGEAAVPPGRGAAGWSGVLLLVSGATMLAWPAYTVVDHGWERYAAMYLDTGSAPRSALLGGVGWQTAAVAGLALAGAAVCFRRGRGARTLGLSAAVQIGGAQVFVLSAYLQGQVYVQFRHLDTHTQLMLVTPPVLCALAAVVLALLLPRPAAAEPGPGGAPWQAPAPEPYGAPGPR